MKTADLRRLRAFVAIAEEEHITRAAERLGMQQPPLTRLLRSLEDELGVLLMHRLPRGVRITDAGRALLEEARAVLSRADGIADIVRRVARGEQGRLAVGYTSSAAHHPFVTTVLRDFGEALPQVDLVLDEAGTGELVDGLLRGQLDAAFVRAPVYGTPGLVADAVLEEPMLVALPGGHPLAGRGDEPLALDALAALPFVLYRRPSGPGLHDAIFSACALAGFSPNVRQEAPRLPGTLSLVAAGLGVSIVPASMRRMNAEGVVYRALQDYPPLVAPLHLAMRQAMQSPALRQFRDLVRKTAAMR
jgi:DNA-binding transcriptional LysR family regulator